MKKEKVNPLDLDKETIARLDEQQLRQIAGGVNDDNGDESNNCGNTCGTGNTVCSPQEVQQ
ncbi:MAG: hypothetical protein AVDCRST_MAG56-4017 [uncultured Cytophagales bacterium]|uniref:Uncharacterized protein n=1 Tax=uncultured Cytophagales bacterium TaxID=158755 RepID=A0A6J4JNK7_9SPHI|nr:MAG: hypothetical protein AVDCRST_MAG56-4017 [uncultured Cytophagales bacterium]